MGNIQPRNERMAIAFQAIDELRAMKRQRPFIPTTDIDIVWVLTAPGTVKEASTDGIYNGENMNIKLLKAGTDMVIDITAKRLELPISMVTKSDIEKVGPRLFYNGEDAKTDRGVDRQNEDLAEIAARPNFPLPLSKLTIDHIDEIGTPAQVKGFIKRANATAFQGKVAVVSMVHHSIRVGRYLEQYKELLHSNIHFVNAPLAERVNTVGKTLREVRKVATYGTKNPPDLAVRNYFFTKHAS